MQYQDQKPAAQGDLPGSLRGASHPDCVHARLDRTPDGWVLTDLASTNGTRVNGWRVRGQVPVRVGDMVCFGTAEYSLSGTDGA